MRSRPWKVVGIVGALLLCAPATAAAAEKPVVTSGAATGIEPTTVVLNGTVTPKGANTTYYFQYGTSSLYGAVTPAGTVAAGSGRVKVTAAVGGLAPVTTYHYRLVAQNSQGVARGSHRTFKTKPQPLGFSFAATPNPVAAGGATTLTGVLTGTNGDDRRIIIKSNPWPYTQGFLPVGNELVTNADGSFSVPVLSVAVNTQFIVQMVARPDVVSAPLVIGATLDVTRRARVVQRGERSGRLRFRGRISAGGRRRAGADPEAAPERRRVADRGRDVRPQRRRLVLPLPQDDPPATRRPLPRAGERGRGHLLAQLEPEHPPSARPRLTVPGRGAQAPRPAGGATQMKPSGSSPSASKQCSSSGAT